MFQVLWGLGEQRVIYFERSAELNRKFLRSAPGIEPTAPSTELLLELFVLGSRSGSNFQGIQGASAFATFVAYGAYRVWLILVV